MNVKRICCYVAIYSRFTLRYMRCQLQILYTNLPAKMKFMYWTNNSDSEYLYISLVSFVCVCVAESNADQYIQINSHGCAYVWSDLILFRFACQF